VWPTTRNSQGVDKISGATDKSDHEGVLRARKTARTVSATAAENDSPIAGPINRRATMKNNLTNDHIAVDRLHGQVVQRGDRLRAGLVQ